MNVLYVNSQWGVENNIPMSIKFNVKQKSSNNIFESR